MIYSEKRALPSSPAPKDSPRSRFALRAIGQALPLGVVILDADLDIAYANEEAVESVAKWLEGDAVAARYKPQALLAVPPEIACACNRLWTERFGSDDPSSKRALNRGLRAAVSCPSRPWLRAVVSLNCQGGDENVGFCVLIGEVDKAKPLLTTGWDWRALLTPAERRVAVLAADGMSNAEIAAELGREASTIKCQMGTILNKLRARTRTRLAALVHSERRTIN